MFANTFYDGAYKRIGAGYATQYEQAAGTHAWYTAGTSTANSSITFTQAMTLDASGNLGVGVTSPVTRVHISGGNTAARGQLTVVGASDDARITLYRDSTLHGTFSSGSSDSYIGTESNTPFRFLTNGTERGRFTTTGNLLVGTTTDVSGRSGTISDISGNVRAIPRTGSAKTSTYTLTVSDVGQFVELGSGGGIDVPNGVFSTGDVVSVFNNTNAARTMSLTITTAYIGGTDADKASVSLATRGVATVLFISNSVCVVTGNVS
jgi:hypothetical protein